MATKRTVDASKQKPAPAADSAMGKLIAKLDRALLAYAPKRHASIRGASDWAPLKTLGPVPASLQTIWSWLDGGTAGEELWITDGERGWETMLSVRGSAEAARMLRETAKFPGELIPFASDGSGNFLVVSPKAILFDWDHETRALKEFGPLSAMVHRTLNAMGVGQLFGGPEAGGDDTKQVDKLVKAVVKAAQPQRALESLVEFAGRLPDAEAVAVLTQPAIRAVVDKERPHERQAWARALADRCAKLGRWDDVITFGALGSSIPWSSLGNLACAQRHFEGALGCFELGSKNDLRGEDGMLECAVGAAYAAKELGKKSEKALLSAAAKAFDAELKTLETTLTKVRAMSPEERKRNNYLPVQIARIEQKLASRLLLRSAIAAASGDAALGKKLMAERDLGSKEALVRHEGIPAVLDAIFATG